MTLPELIAGAGGIVTRSEMAKEWGYSRQHLSALSNREDFPAPFYVMSEGTALYLREDLEAWKASYVPRAHRRTNRERYAD